MKKTRATVSSWFAGYGKATFTAFDAKVAALVGAGLGSLAFHSFQVRDQAGVLHATVLGVCAGLLGLTLAAMAIVTAFVTKSFVAVVRDIREALMPFATVATIAAIAMLISMFGLVLNPARWWLVAALMTAAGWLMAWAIVGAVGLVELLMFFAGIRAQELKTLTDAESLVQVRLAKGG